MDDDVLDLFGNPVRPRRGQRGRPAFEVTDRNINKVKLLLAMGWQLERIANAIECSVATLKRHFRPELKGRMKMRDAFEAERLMVVAEQAAAGNIGAHRQLDRLVERNDRMDLERRLGEAPDRVQPATGRPGKKQVDAERAAEADADLMAELEAEASRLARH